MFAGERGFRFRHLLIRDAAYESIPKERARRAARALRALARAARPGERIVEFEEVVGYHLEQAVSLSRRARQPTTRRASSAARRPSASAPPADARSPAATRPRRSTSSRGPSALLPPDDPAARRPRPERPRRPGHARRPELGGPGADRGASRPRRRRRPPTAAHALVQRGFLRLFTEPDVDAGRADRRRRATRSAVFERLGDELGLARAWRLVAQAHYLARRGGACAEASERALEHARRADDRVRGARDRRVARDRPHARLHAGSGSPAALRAARRRCRGRPLSPGDPLLDPRVSRGDAGPGRRCATAAGRGARRRRRPRLPEPDPVLLDLPRARGAPCRPGRRRRASAGGRVCRTRGARREDELLLGRRIARARPARPQRLRRGQRSHAGERRGRTSQRRARERDVAIRALPVPRGARRARRRARPRRSRRSTSPRGATSSTCTATRSSTLPRSSASGTTRARRRTRSSGRPPCTS